MTADLYNYEARITRWVDGDTVDMHVDLGFTISVDTRFRLLGVDTPERGKPGWAEASNFAKAYAPVGTAVTFHSVKPVKADKYGRWLADIFVDGNDVSVNTALLAAGLAVPYWGGTKQ